MTYPPSPLELNQAMAHAVDQFKSRILRQKKQERQELVERLVFIILERYEYVPNDEAFKDLVEQAEKWADILRPNT